jgi:hypothetical protein
LDFIETSEYDQYKEEPFLPDGLEEAAEDFGKRQGLELRPFAKKFFKAGAEWQKEQMMDEWLKDRDGCFWDGVEEGKKAMEKQMLEGAVEVEVKEDAGGSPIVPLNAIELYDYENDKPLAKAGDKVRVIVIKEDKK